MKPFLRLTTPKQVTLGGLLGSRGGRADTGQAFLGVSLAVGVALALLAQAASGALGGYRLFGILVYGVGGLLWASLGASLASLDVRQDR